MTAALEGGEWSTARPGRTLPPGKTRYPFYRRLGGTQGRSGRAENLVPTGIRSRSVQPVVSRYTVWATRLTSLTIMDIKNLWLFWQNLKQVPIPSQFNLFHEIVHFLFPICFNIILLLSEGLPLDVFCPVALNKKSEKGRSTSPYLTGIYQIN